MIQMQINLYFCKRLVSGTIIIIIYYYKSKPITPSCGCIIVLKGTCAVFFYFKTRFTLYKIQNMLISYPIEKLKSRSVLVGWLVG